MSNFTFGKHIEDWMNIVERGDQLVGRDMKLLVQLVNKKLSQPDVVVDQRKINDAIDLIETYEPYKLAPIQRFLHALNVGVRYDTGFLVWNKLFLLCARGFGKNSFLSDSAFYLTSNRNGVQKYNVDIVANNEDQAKTSFMDVYDLIDGHQNLQRAYDYSKTEITFKKTRSTISYYTSNAKTKDGLRPGLVAFDEVHAYENYDQIKVFTSALGKVEDPRTYILTTDGNVRGAVLDDYKAEALEVLQGMNADSKMLPVYSRIDSYDQWDKPECWVMANPMLPYLPILQQQYKDDFESAKRSPDLKIEFLTKRLNWPIEDASHNVADWEDILATNQEIPDLTGSLAYGGVDYADVRDWTSVGLLIKHGNKRYWLHHSFVTAESLRLTRYKINIERAVQEGLLTVVPGKIMDPALVAAWFVEKASKYRIKLIATDRFRYELLKEEFGKVGLPLKAIPSGAITDSKLAPLIDSMFINHTLVYGNDFLMRWFTNNVYVKMDGKGNKAFEKIDPETRKTDGFMALVHALALEDDPKQERHAAFNPRLRTWTR